MALVGYSDSEGSDDEQPQPKISVPKQIASTTTTKPTFNSLVDKSNPRKIRVNLSGTAETNGDGADAERAPKRARTEGGAFSGFNSLLPPPKKTAQATNGTATSASKGAPRKVFSLKTGAERGFDRAADAELKQMFAEQEAERQHTSTDNSNGYTKEEHVAPTSSAAPTTTSERVVVKQGNPMMFKPLSVARNPQKKKKPIAAPPVLPSDNISKPSNNPIPISAEAKETPPPAKPKISLFSTASKEEPSTTTTTQIDTYEPLIYSAPSTTTTSEPTPASTDPSSNSNSNSNSNDPQTLASIARDLNLSPSAQRQLFGRHGPSSGSNILHFSTDAEWSANKALRASGEAEDNQHHQVKAIAPGKHSLKQLISSASGQMEALEESFAAGKRRKGEGGAKYGW